MKLIAVPRFPIEELLAPGEKPDAELIDGVRRLSRLFTIDRDRLGLDYLSDPALRRAYLLYFAPVNLAKCLSVLAELPPLPADHCGSWTSVRALEWGLWPCFTIFLTKAANVLAVPRWSLPTVIARYLLKRNLYGAIWPRWFRHSKCRGFIPRF